jgi:hypothetical protein
MKEVFPVIYLLHIIYINDKNKVFVHRVPAVHDDQNHTGFCPLLKNEQKGDQWGTRIWLRRDLENK